MNLAKKSQFHFSFFKVNSQNPTFNLEYLKYDNALFMYRCIVDMSSIY